MAGSDPTGEAPAQWNVALVHELIAAAVPDRYAIVHRDRRFTFAELTDRSRRVAGWLAGQRLGCHAERSELAPWESGQDHIGLYLRNGPEYLETMVGAMKARTAPFNVNYRYVADELRDLLGRARPSALVYGAEFAPVLAEVLDHLDARPILLQVEDESDEALLDGATPYADALVHAPLEPADLSPDDLFMIFTGGTTGLPKGVLWRQADMHMAALGGRDNATGVERATADEILAFATEPRVHPYLVAAPFMHAAGSWLAFQAWAGGDPVVIPDEVSHLDPVDILRVIEREGIRFIVVVGDAFIRPIIDELRTSRYNASSLRIISTGGAAMTAGTKAEILELLPKVTIVDTVGSSESGAQGRMVTSAGGSPVAGRFEAAADSTVLTAELDGRLAAGSDAIGWFARRGRIPLGYLDDPDATRRTFPTVDGVRWSVPGDRARLLADGSIELLGRDSVTVNTGGEKVFVEEVEQILVAEPEVYDVVVVGRASERWGQEVAAIVQPTSAAMDQPDLADRLRDRCRQHLAGYKVPKDIVLVERVLRSPSGKADYRWAAALVSGEAPPGE